MLKNISYRHAFYFITLALGFIWIRSGYGKLSSGEFPETLAKTLLLFASKNPYLWYKAFLLTFAIPNAYLFGLLTQWGEFLSGISLFLGSLASLFIKKYTRLITSVVIGGLIGGMFLNATFYLASGWMSPSGESLNLLMFIVELVCLATLVISLKHKTPNDKCLSAEC